VLKRAAYIAASASNPRQFPSEPIGTIFRAFSACR
jgi:hypothetical protein